MKTIANTEAHDPHYAGWEARYKEQTGDAEAWSAEPQPFLPGIVAQVKRNAKVLDIGAGDGRNTELLLRAGHDVTALDLAPTALHALLKRMRVLNLPAPTAVHASLEAMPLASDQFTHAFCWDTLPQVKNCRLALEEIHRVLKPGGLCALNVFTPRDCAFGEGQQIAPRSFLFKQTLFHFFEEDDMSQLCAGLLDVVTMEHAIWEDPPHVPFRPYRHTHDALVYVLKKPGDLC